MAQLRTSDALETLVQDLQSALGDQLHSVILYGSAASDDVQAQRSNLNILCAVTQLAPADLARCAPVFRRWREGGHPPPLLLTRDEIVHSTDCFPIEFQDMADRRQVLWGEDVIKGLAIDSSFYRAQVEHELRAKQIRLRQKAADLLDSPKQLMELMADSLSTFCVLGRHALILHGHQALYKKAEILVALERTLELPMTGSNAILAFRSMPGASASGSTTEIFQQYLTELEALVGFVDRLEKERKS